MEPQSSVNNAPQVRRKRGGLIGLIVAVIVLLLLAGAAYVFMNSDKMAGVTGGGGVLASVNGTPITEDEVTERISHAKTGLEAQGLNLEDPQTRDLLRSQALEEIINERVVLADAQAKGVVVTDAEVDTQFNDIRSRFETEAQFTEELGKNQFTPETLRENVRRELLIQKYVAQISEASTLTVSEEEVTAFYDQLKGQNESLPPLTELRAEIEVQLKNQKLAGVVQQIVAELRSKADVQINAGTSAQESAE